MTEHALAAYYTKQYQDERFKCDLEGRPHDMFGDAEERRRKIADRHVEIQLTDRHIKSGRVLDVGSGAGLYFEGLRGQHELHALEVSPLAAAFVRERFVAQVQQSTVQEATYKEASFDVVNLTYVIEHVGNPLAVLKRVVTWLKPGGLLLVSSPNWGSIMARLYREFFRLNEPNQHICLWDPSTLTRALTRSGAHVRRLHYPYFHTEYFNLYEIRRLLTNSVIQILLPALLRLGLDPAPKHVLSPPFWQSIMVAEAYRCDD